MEFWATFIQIIYFLLIHHSSHLAPTLIISIFLNITTVMVGNSEQVDLVSTMWLVCSKGSQYVVGV